MELGNNWREIAKVVVTYKDGRRRVLPQDEVKLRFPIKPLMSNDVRIRLRKRVQSQRMSDLAANGMRKLNEGATQKIISKYRELVDAGKKYGAIKKLAQFWNVSSTHIANILRKHGAK